MPIKGTINLKKKKTHKHTQNKLVGNKEESKYIYICIRTGSVTWPCA